MLPGRNVQFVKTVNRVRFADAQGARHRNTGRVLRARASLRSNALLGERADRGQRGVSDRCDADALNGFLRCLALCPTRVDSGATARSVSTVRLAERPLRYAVHISAEQSYRWDLTPAGVRSQRDNSGSG